MTKEHYSSFLHPDLKKNLLYFFFWKNVSTGWKVGYLLARRLTAKFRSHQQYISFSTNAPVNMQLPNI
jgi:methionine aminotransferase